MKRTICIQNPASLSVESSSLVVAQNGRKVPVPLEDIWVVILETNRANVTTSALSRLADEGIGVMMCGRDHMPNALMLPLGAHSRHAAIVEDQLAISKPLKKRLWQRIVKAKILNQATVLEMTEHPESAARLRSWAKEVLSGDTSGREAVSAGLYFRHLIPVGGRRAGPYAAALDYGYTVLRAGVGRMAVSGGWLVSRGIHHSSDLNAFNLVDDLIEPFRPVIDLLVVVEGLCGDLTSAVRARLASVFELEVRMGACRVTVQTAIESLVSSLREAILGADASLLELPQVIPLQRIVVE